MKNLEGSNNIPSLNRMIYGCSKCGFYTDKTFEPLKSLIGVFKGLMYYGIFIIFYTNILLLNTVVLFRLYNFTTFNNKFLITHYFFILKSLRYLCIPKYLQADSPKPYKSPLKWIIESLLLFHFSR